jgi:hypothetical protein
LSKKKRREDFVWGRAWEKPNVTRNGCTGFDLEDVLLTRITPYISYEPRNTDIPPLRVVISSARRSTAIGRR